MMTRRHASARRLGRLGAFENFWNDSGASTTGSPAAAVSTGPVPAAAAADAAPPAAPAEGCPSWAPHRNAQGWCTNAPAAASAPAAVASANTFTDPFTGKAYEVSPYVTEANNQPGTLILDQNLAQNLADLAEQQGQALGLDVACRVQRSDYPVAQGYVLEPVCAVNGDAGYNAELLTKPGGWQILVTELNRQRAADQQVSIPGLLTSASGFGVPVGSSLPAPASGSSVGGSPSTGAPGAGGESTPSSSPAVMWQQLRDYIAEVPTGVWLGLGAVAVLIIASQFAGRGRR